MKLQAQDKAKTVLDILEELASHPACEFSQKLTIDGNDLRHIHHRVSSQARRLRRHQDIPGSIDKTKVGAQHDGNDGVQATPIEGIALNDQHRAVVPGIGALGLTQVRRPDLAPFNYHGSRVSDRLCRRLRARGSRLSSGP